MTHNRGASLLLALAVLVMLAGCEAGPPAFGHTVDDEASHGPVDTADVADLPDVPRAADVETDRVSVAEGLVGADAAGTDPAVTVDAIPEPISWGTVPATAPGAATAAALVDSAERAAAAAPGDLASGAAADAAADSGPLAAGASDSVDPASVDVPTSSNAETSSEDSDSAEPPRDPSAVRFPRPESVRGLYVNAWAAGSRGRMRELLDIAGRTEVNALVIDIKDASGYVSHRTEVPLAHEIGATGEVRIRDIEALLNKLDSAGIYPIARIVIVKDPLLAEFRPELAVQDTAGGPWIDSKGTKWLNPYDSAVWDYHVEIAREVAELGFPEIQWDYVRFPDAPASELDRAVFYGADGRTKAQGVREFLSYSHEELAELDVLTTADVFGVTTSASRDVGIGQLWESFIDVVDVALPMVYPSHYWEGSFGVDTPNAYPYEIVRHALTDALRRSEGVDGAGLTRPWLQDFSLGEPLYNAPEVRAQIQATYDAGIDEWVLWNPGSRYTEGALEPTGGFRFEPWLRVGGTIVPVSRRFDALEAARVAEAEREAAEAAREAAARQAARDSAAARAAADSLPGGEIATDTIAAQERPDTIPRAR